MNYFEGILLGALQGVTEFLPISSSGHLVLGEYFLGLNVEVLKSFDVFVHLATFLAIVIYFHEDVKKFLLFEKSHRKLMLYIIIGTIPAVLLGLFGEEWLDATFRNVNSVAVMMIIVGLIFLWAEIFYKRIPEKKKMENMKWHQALIIGVAQAAALIPGISRSGSTIVGGIFQGIERADAARFSFLLGLPAMLGAFTLTVVKTEGLGDVAVGPSLAGFLAALTFGLISISFLMRFLKNNSLNVFAFYRILLGIIILLNFL